MSEPAILFYEEDCSFCRKTARWLTRLSRGRLRAAPLDSPEADRLLGHLSDAERYSQSWVADRGRLYGGSDGMWECFYRLPGGFLLRPLRWLPGFQAASRRFYRWIANRRSPACRARSHS